MAQSATVPSWDGRHAGSTGFADPFRRRSSFAGGSGEARRPPPERSDPVFS